MAHALKSKAVAVDTINWSRALDLAIVAFANFGIWALIVSAPGALRQLGL
jgi:hypothetical protein